MQSYTTPAQITPATLVLELVHKNGLEGCFGGVGAFAWALAEIVRTDAAYGPLDRGAPFFYCKGRPCSGLTATFNSACVAGWNDDVRPSLPALAVAMLERNGVDAARLENTDARTAALARAIILVAARAEMVRGLPPTPEQRAAANGYHNTLHTAYVALLTETMAEHHQALAEAGQPGVAAEAVADRLLDVLEALSHDIDHPGKPNPAGDLFFNEDRSFRTVEPLLRAAGVGERDIETLKLTLYCTSPDGPHAALKASARAWLAGEAQPELDPRMAVLAPLLRDRDRTLHAARVSDADFAASAGCGVESSAAMGQRLSRECGKDLTTPGAQRFFLRTLFGGFSSPAGRDLFTAGYEELVRRNDAALQAAQP